MYEDMSPERFKIATYLSLAEELQALPHEDRVAKLRAMSVDPLQAHRVIILCRMLFEAKPAGVFRHPMIGGGTFIDSSGEAGWDGEKYVHTVWPLDPITIYKGVPILIVYGYGGTGIPELPADYLHYCINECREHDERFHQLSQSELDAIIEAFLIQYPAFERDAIVKQAR